MTVSGGSRVVQYAVGFKRNNVKDTPLYIDLERKLTYYTIEISTPTMRFEEGGIKQSAEFVLYFILTDRIANTVNWSLGDYTLSDTVGEVTTTTTYSTALYLGAPEADGSLSSVVDSGKLVAGGNTGKDLDALVTEPPGKDETGKDKIYVLKRTTTRTQSGQTVQPEPVIEYAKVTGFHFEQEAPYSGNQGEEELTTVRLNFEYNYNGGCTLSFMHVAPIEETVEGDDNQQVIIIEYVHPVTFDNFGTKSETSVYGEDDKIYNISVEAYSQDGSFAQDNIISSIVGEDSFIGTCTSDMAKAIDLSAVSIDPLYNYEFAEDGTTVSAVSLNNIDACISRSHYIEMTAVFAQASSAGA